MSTVSPQLSETARKVRGALLRGLASVGQSNVAIALGVSETMVSRWKSDGEVDRIAALLDLCGLKAVPREMKCYPPEQVEWLLLGNRIAAQKVRTAGDLTEEVDE